MQDGLTIACGAVVVVFFSFVEQDTELLYAWSGRIKGSWWHNSKRSRQWSREARKNWRNILLRLGNQVNMFLHDCVFAISFTLCAVSRWRYITGFGAQSFHCKSTLVAFHDLFQRFILFFCFFCATSLPQDKAKITSYCIGDALQGIQCTRILIPYISFSFNWTIFCIHSFNQCLRICNMSVCVYITKWLPHELCVLVLSVYVIN